MKQQPTTHLWSAAGELRGLSADESVEILAQIAVLAALAYADGAADAPSSSRANSSRVSIDQLLDSGVKSLEARGVLEPTELLDRSSKGWSSLTANSIHSAKESLTRAMVDPEQLAKSLLRLVRDRPKAPISVPQEISELVADLNLDAERVYLPFDESALSVFELTTPDQDVILRPKTAGTRRLLRRVLFLADRSVELQSLDPYSIADIPPRSVVVVYPPFGDKVDARRLEGFASSSRAARSVRSEELALQWVVNLLSETSPVQAKHVSILLPAGMLFRGGVSQVLREQLVDQLEIMAVIEFPPRVLAGTSIGSALLLARANAGESSSTIRLISVSGDNLDDEQRAGRFRLSNVGDLSAMAQSGSIENTEAVLDVERSLIRDSDYVLNPARYQTQALERLTHGARVVNLGSLCQIIRPISFKDAAREIDGVYSEVLMSDFKLDSTVDNGSKSRSFDAATNRKVQRQKLRAGDILLGVKGTVGKVAMVTDGAGEDLLAGQATVILRLEDHDRIPDPVYLLRYLAQPAVTEYLESLSGGSAISFVRAKDIEGLAIPIRSPAEQKEICQIHERIVSAFTESRRLADEARRLNITAFELRGEGEKSVGS